MLIVSAPFVPTSRRLHRDYSPIPQYRSVFLCSRRIWHYWSLTVWRGTERELCCEIHWESTVWNMHTRLIEPGPPTAKWTCALLVLPLKYRCRGSERSDFASLGVHSCLTGGPQRRSDVEIRNLLYPRSTSRGPLFENQGCDAPGRNLVQSSFLEDLSLGEFNHILLPSSLPAALKYKEPSYLGGFRHRTEQTTF